MVDLFCEDDEEKIWVARRPLGLQKAQLLCG
jgi:hypothetical protein